MTVHNRRDTTLSCLRALFTQSGIGSQFEARVYLVDDGSTDGTARAVAAEFPAVAVIAGTGQMYWAAGMARAEQAGAESRPDAYLWLNDDTLLLKDALSRLFEVVSERGDVIAVGATRAHERECITYGGRLREGGHPMRFGPLREPIDTLACDTFEGNAVLVPAAVRQKVGPIDGGYPHAYADTDYGLRASELGIPILQVKGYIGLCDDRPPNRRSASPWRAWRELNSPKGLPWRAQMKFLRRHGDWRWGMWLVGGQIKQVVARTGMPRP
jgi:GT2 family glycosyltransferase